MNFAYVVSKGKVAFLLSNVAAISWWKAISPDNNVILVIVFSVSFAGSLAVLVTIQLLVALSVVNLVSRSDSPPSFLIWPLQGTLGNFLCLSDMPLVGQVDNNWKSLVIATRFGSQCSCGHKKN